MDAGTRLDAEVAEHVMGRDMTKPEGFKYPIGLPRYSTDIRAAWQVAERFGRFEVGRNATGWYCLLAFGGEDDLMAFDLRRSDTAPLAICRAALQAVAAVGTPTREA